MGFVGIFYHFLNKIIWALHCCALHNFKKKEYYHVSFNRSFLNRVHLKQVNKGKRRQKKKMHWDK
jgi:hypothetical protein